MEIRYNPAAAGAKSISTQRFHILVRMRIRFDVALVSKQASDIKHTDLDPCYHNIQLLDVKALDSHIFYLLLNT